MFNYSTAVIKGISCSFVKQFGKSAKRLFEGLKIMYNIIKVTTLRTLKSPFLQQVSNIAATNATKMSLISGKDF